MRARALACACTDGLQGPTTYNACPSTRWNNGVSFPIQSGHGCIGCSEQNFWDQGSFYDRITTIPHLGTNATAETVGVAAVAGVAAGVAVHGVASMVRHAGSKNTKNSSDTDSKN
jgi:Ni,Fe-hydrogenase I small subunit